MDLITIWPNVPMVWLYPIQFCIELTLVGYPLNFCVSMQKHPCTVNEVPPILVPSLVIIKNSPSPSMVFFNPHTDFC